MEKKLANALMLPLKGISLRRVAVILWCRSDSLLELDRHGVEENMKELMIPPSLIEEMNYLVKPIRSELRKWKKFHEVYLHIQSINLVCISKHLCWTVLGHLDYQKTAEGLIRHEAFDTFMLYRLACIYCLDRYIPTLFEMLPEESKNYFYKKDGPLKLSEPLLEFCWPYIIKGEESRLDYVLLNLSGERVTFNQCAFEYSAYKGNKAACEYFSRKLPHTLRPDYLLILVLTVLGRGYLSRFDEYSYDDFPKGKFVEIFLHLLSVMKPEQQAEYFKNYAANALVCFLDWPWQNLFLETVELYGNMLDVEKSHYLLFIIFVNIKKGYDNTEIFRAFFLHCSNDFINFLIEREMYINVLRWFMKVKDSETIRVIFRKLNSVQRQTVVSCETVFQLFCTSILEGQWPVVELCLKEATLSKENKEQLKQIYVGFLANVDLNEDISTRECLWKQFLYFFDS